MTDPNHPTTTYATTYGRVSTGIRRELIAPPQSKKRLVHPQIGSCAMGYSSFHETSNIRPGTVGRGARRPRNGAALQGDLRDASLPDPSGERPRPLATQDSREPRVRLADGQKRHPHLQREGSGRFGRRLLDPQARVRGLRRAKRPSLAGHAPPLSEGVRV